ncbi:CdaR family protein [Acetivibrio straminisolvens]|uniref:Secreted protein n=1 Tax=Acetivibrio straminisolvens JCM 21531 TaxID=1294263 RepID=W4V9I3_9FIRM|nr:CdaR family protein [Acetivibrio straminisolvens]GAE89846.1 secreted protein [Acetivibrio straminisolvens JCM 21531]
MNELLKRDLTLKIVSVFFAIFLWFVVLDSSNPVTWIELNVPLKIENESSLREKGIMIKNENFPRNVSVSLKGRKNTFNNIGLNDIEAIVDLSKVEDVNTQFLYVNVYTNKDGVSFQGVTPRVVEIELEKLGENPFPVKVVPTGKPKEGYKVVRSNAIPATVSIEAPDEIINSIGEVRAYVDVDNLSNDIIVNKECLVYNKEGEKIAELDKKISVDISIEIAKEVPIVPAVRGRPAKNYTDGIHRVVPEKAWISGSSEIIDQIDNLKTEPIDIDNISESMTKIVNLALPEGVRLVDTPRSVYVDVVIEELAEREFVFGKESIEFDNTARNNSFRYEVLDEIIKITLTGTRQELNKIAPESLRLSVDVNGLSEGEYKRPINVVLPDTVKLVENYDVKISVKRN